MSNHTTQVRVFGPNLRDQSKSSFHVHDERCSDCDKYAYLGQGLAEGWHMTATSKEDIAAEIYADHIDEGSMTVDDAMTDVHFLPCVKFGGAALTADYYDGDHQVEEVTLTEYQYTELAYKQDIAEGDGKEPCASYLAAVIGSARWTPKRTQARVVIVGKPQAAWVACELKNAADIALDSPEWLTRSELAQGYALDRKADAIRQAVRAAAAGRLRCSARR